MSREAQPAVVVLLHQRGIAQRWFGRGSTLGRVTQRRVNAIALGWIVLVVLSAAIGPYIAPHDPLRISRNIHQGISQTHWLGTDELGRDILSRLLYGARVSVQVGFIAVGIATAIGVPLGLVAGFRGGIVDEVIMRFMDAIIILPTLVFALAIAAALGPSVTTIFFAIGITICPRYARLMRGQVLSAKEQDYVLAARAMGTSAVRIGLRHMLPNTIQPIIVAAALSIGFAILTETSLSFLGVGIQPPNPSWGSELRAGFRYLQTNLIESFAPGMAIFLTVLAVNLVGDGLRDALDPRLRGS